MCIYDLFWIGHSRVCSRLSGFLQRRQHAARGDRRLVDLGAESGQGVAHGVGDRCRRGDRTTFTHALHAVFSGGGRGVEVADLDRRQFGCPRQEVVGQGTGGRVGRRGGGEFLGEGGG